MEKINTVDLVSVKAGQLLRELQGMLLEEAATTSGAIQYLGKEAQILSSIIDELSDREERHG